LHLFLYVEKVLPLIPFSTVLLNVRWWYHLCCQCTRVFGQYDSGTLC